MDNFCSSALNTKAWRDGVGALTILTDLNF